MTVPNEHWPTAAPFATGGEAAAAVNAVSGAGGWSLSTEQLEDLIDRLDRLERRLAVARENADPMIKVKPPGNDPHSAKIADVMNDSGRVYLQSLVEQRRYVEDLRTAMQHSLDAYRGVEHDNSDIARKATGESDGTL